MTERPDFITADATVTNLRDNEVISPSLLKTHITAPNKAAEPWTVGQELILRDMSGVLSPIADKAGLCDLGGVLVQPQGARGSAVVGESSLPHGGNSIVFDNKPQAHLKHIHRGFRILGIEGIGEIR